MTNKSKRVSFDMAMGPSGRIVPVVCEIHDYDDGGQVELISGDVALDDLEDVYEAARRELAANDAANDWRDTPKLSETRRREQPGAIEIEQAKYEAGLATIRKYGP